MTPADGGTLVKIGVPRAPYFGGKGAAYLKAVLADPAKRCDYVG